MKKLIIPILAIVLLMPGCKFFKKKGWFGGKSEKLEKNIQQLQNKMRSDSLRYLDEFAKLQEESTSKLAELKEECDEKNNKFQVVVGGFMIPSNADKYSRLMTQKGYNAKVLVARNGFHLVSVNSTGDKRAAINQLRAVKQELEPAAWLYVN